MKGSRLLLILSMVSFGTIGLFVRNITLTDGTALASGEVALYRALLAIAVLGGYLLVMRQPIPLRKIKKQLPLLMLSGAAMGLNWVLLFEAYKYTSVSVATLSYYFAPVIVTLLCPILFRERTGVKSIICFVMATAGIVMITGFGDGTGSSHIIGVLLGLSAAVLYATVILLNKFIGGVDGIHRTFLQFIAAAAVLVPYVIFSGTPGITSLGTVGWICLITVGIFHTGITYCAYFISIKALPGQEAAILSYIDPLVAVVCSVTILQEPLTVWQAVGGALILGFTLLCEIPLPFGKGKKAK